MSLRRVDGAVSQRCRPRPVEHPQQLARRQQSDPPGGQFDRQRDPIEPLHQRHDLVVGQRQLRRDVRGATPEQLTGGGPRTVGPQRLNRDNLFAGSAQPHPRRRQHRAARCEIEQFAHAPTGIVEVLEIVEHDEALATGERRRVGPPSVTLSGHGRQAERRRRRRGDHVNVALVGEVDEHDTVWMFVVLLIDDPAGHGKRQTGLAYTARPDERDQSRARDPREQLLDLALATDEGRALDGQPHDSLRRGCRPGSRRSGE